MGDTRSIPDVTQKTFKNSVWNFNTQILEQDFQMCHETDSFKNTQKIIPVENAYLETRHTGSG